MAYEGSVELISGIKQANNGTFPLVDASAVRVTDSKRLDEALTDIGSDKADKTDTILETTMSRGRKATATVGTGSFAFGSNVEASGNYSHAEGNQTVANHYSQHVFGEFNSADDSSEAVSSRGNFVEIVGNGSSENARSNARALDWQGNEYLNGDLYINCDDDSDNGTSVAGAIATLATKADVANPVFTGSISNGRKANTSAKQYSIAIGTNCEASEEGSHAEGNNTVSNGPYSYVFGEYNVVETIPSTWSTWLENHDYSVGDRVKRTISVSTTLGNRYTRTYAYCITAHTSSSNFSSDSANWWYISVQSMTSTDLFVDPVFNEQIEIVGNGGENWGRSNARVLDKLGNERLGGDLYVRCNADSSGGTKVISLPPVTSSDDGSILCVVDGEWTMLPGAFTKMEKTISAEMLSTSLDPGESKSLNFLSTDIPDCMIKSTVAVKTASFSNLPSSVVGEVTSIGYSARYGISYRVKLTNESESAYVNVPSDAAVSLTYSYYSF